MSSSIRRRVAVTREGFREYCSIVLYVTSRDSSRGYYIVFEVSSVNVFIHYNV